MKNKKGFTLVELLVVIVILGVITGISIPLIRNIQKVMADKKYSAYLTSLKTSAKLYNDSYSEDLFGHNITGVTCVSYQELEKRKLLKDIGIDEISCDTDRTFVRITKLDDKYTYTPYLVCGKEKNGKVTTIEKVLPENSSQEATNDFCKQDINSTMIIRANPSISLAYDKKRKSPKLTIESVTGIYNKMNLKVAWSNSTTPPSDSQFEDISFKVEGNQKEKIFNGNIITTSSRGILTPEGGNGLYYLHVKVVNLKDIYGNKWKNPDKTDSPYIKFGPYGIDNTPPTINNLRVTSREKGYNSTDTTLTFNGYDNLSGNDMKMCISVGSEACNTFKKYASSSSLDVLGKYDGKERKIYVTLKDLAGNKTVSLVKYTVATTHRITYNSNGGTTCSPTYKDVIHNANDGKTWGTLCSPTRTGYKFAGWNTKTDGSGDTITNTSVITNNITVYAQWKINKINIKIHMNGGYLSPYHGATIGTSGSNITVNGNVFIQTIDYGKNLAASGLPDWNNSNYINILKPGYQAKAGSEWNLQANGGVKSYNQTRVYAASEFCDASKNDCTAQVYVNWTPAVYTVTLNANGGSVSPTSISIIYNSAYGSSLPTPSRSGYTFNGWYTAPSGGTKITSSTIYRTTGNSTIYAQWTPKPPSCTLSLSGTAGLNGWYKSGVTVTMNTSGVVSSKGLAESPNSKNGSTSIYESVDGTHTYYGYVENAGGSNSCSATFSLDWHGPSCSLSFNGTDGAANWNSYYLTCTGDNMSGCAGDSAGAITSTSEVGVIDNAGNLCAGTVEYLMTTLHYVPGGSTDYNIPIRAYDTIYGNATKHPNRVMSKVSATTVYFIKYGILFKKSDTTMYKLNFDVSGATGLRNGRYYGTTANGGYWTNSADSFPLYVWYYTDMNSSNIASDLYACYINDKVTLCANGAINEPQYSG